MRTPINQWRARNTNAYLVLNDHLNVILLLAAAFGAGALNAVAGGGSFLTLPALVFTGMPPVAANATGTVALFPGYVSGALGFREDMEALPGLSLRNLTILSLARIFHESRSAESP